MSRLIWGPHAARGLKLDCRNFRGDRPCRAGVPGLCPTECAAYSPMGRRILIIKLGALGDVIRTAALLPGLKAVWPQSHITWLSRPSGVRMLANHPLIDRLVPFDAETVCHLEHERFDLCLSLDKEPGPAALAMRVDASERRGIGLSTYGTVFPLNPECAEYFELGLDNELKFRRNTRSYPELVYAALGLTYRGEKYTLHPSRADAEYAQRCWDELGVQPGEAVVGLNTGAGRVFANKNWPAQRFEALARRLISAGIRVALLGGPDEQQLNTALAASCEGLLYTGSFHSELQFAAIVARCDALVTGDTMAMHVAIAADVPSVVLFGPTCPAEIDLFGRGEKLAAEMPCAPCYARTCDRSPNCMDRLSVDEVLAAVQRVLRNQPGSPTKAKHAVSLPVLGVTT